MERRKFLSLTAGIFAMALVPNTMKAEDFRKLKPNAWTATKVDAAIQALYGRTDMIEKGVFIKAAKIAASGARVKLKFGSKVPAKSVALLQDVNPESTVAVFSVTKYDLMDYQLNIKMAKSGTVTVVAEGLDGNLYVARHKMKVAAGGCEG